MSDTRERSVFSPAENGVELFAPGRDLENTLSLLTELMCSLEAASGRLHDRSVGSEDARRESCTWHLTIASLTLSTLISLKPLILSRLRRVAECTEAIV
jgi:hypothetical protein